MRKKRQPAFRAPAAPGPKQMIRWSAENVARTAIESHPQMRRAKDEITRAVMAATEKALRTTLRGGGRRKPPAD